MPVAKHWAVDAGYHFANRSRHAVERAGRDLRIGLPVLTRVQNQRHHGDAGSGRLIRVTVVKGRRWLQFAGLVAIAVGVVLAWSLRTTPEVQVTTAPLTVGSIARRIVTTGTIQAVTTVEVGSQVSGTIQALGADYNSTVRAGQVLARIDPATYDADLREAQGALALAPGRRGPGADDGDGCRNEVGACGGARSTAAHSQGRSGWRGSRQAVGGCGPVGGGSPGGASQARHGTSQHESRSHRDPLTHRRHRDRAEHRDRTDGCGNAAISQAVSRGDRFQASPAAGSAR